MNRLAIVEELERASKQLKDLERELLRRQAEIEELEAIARAVVEWAKTPQDHGGNPYRHKFCRMAVSWLDRKESREPTFRR